MNVTDIQAILRVAPEEARNTFTLRMVGILLVVAESNVPIRLRDAAERLGIPKPATTRGSKSLERFGLLERNRAQKDMRDCWLSLTDNGRMVADVARTVQRRAA
jgi:DNA-binding MarR family transcriptional regulator